jgi:hypothetical protein
LDPPRLARSTRACYTAQHFFYVARRAPGIHGRLPKPHRYVLHFKADQLPPVKAFWSLSIYKLPEQLFIENPIKRYTIGDRTPGLEYGPDGSLTVYLQHESRGAEKDANWLPAPDGPFCLTMRIYWPEQAALDGDWTPPPVVRVA